MATKAFLEQAYLAYFGRPIDPNGVAAFVNSTETEVENAFWASPESQALYGDVFGLQQINMVYNILFGRDAEPAGLAYWANQIVIGALTPAGAAIGILRGALNDDIIAVNNKLAASAAFTAGLDTTDEILGFAGDAAAAVAREWLQTVTMTPATQEEVDAAIVAAVAVGNNTGGQTFTLTTGQDVIVGTAGNDTILGINDDSGADLVRTLSLGDKIDGGAGTDTLQISTYADDLDIGLATVANVETLLVKNSYDHFGSLNVAQRDFQSVVVDYQGTDHYDDLYIDNINGTTDLTIQNVKMYDGYYFYRNYDERYDGSEGSVSVTNTLQNWEQNDSYSYYEGYNYFSAATEINHTLNVMNIDAADEGVYIYDYIEASVDGAVVNTTINVDNLKTDDTEYSDVYVEVQQDSGESSDVNAVVNVSNSNSVYFYVDAYASGDDDGNDVIVWNADGLTDTYGYAAFESSGFEDITVNVAAGGAELYYLDDNDTIAGGDQTITINAAGDLTVEYTYFDGTVDDVTMTVTGAGNVTLGESYLGDGEATDTVTVDATALTGNFKMSDENGYAASITSGSGNDAIKVGGFMTTVNTGAGDDTVNTNGYDFGDVDAKTLDGGTGRNTIVINNGALLDAGTAANISNFQVLGITGAVGVNVFDMSVESSLDAVVAKGSLGTVTISNAAAGTTVSLTSADSAHSTVDALTYVLKTATGTSDNFALALAAIDTDVKKNDKDASMTTGTVTANAIETISISSKASTTDGSLDGEKLFTAADYLNTVSVLSADAVKTLTLTGGAQLKLIDVVATALTKVDASAMTGSLTITLDGSANASAVAVLGGSAADTISMVGNVAANNIIVGNGGADTTILAAGGTKETVRYAADTDSVLTLVDTTDPVVTPVVYDVAKGFDIIWNFTSGEDKIELSTGLGLATGDARSVITGKGTFGDGAIADNAELAATLQTLIGSGTGFFNDGAVNRAVATALLDDATDSTFVFIDTNADGNFTNGTDQAIQMAGISTVLITDFMFG